MTPSKIDDFITRHFKGCLKVGRTIGAEKSPHLLALVDYLEGFDHQTLRHRPDLDAELRIAINDVKRMTAYWSNVNWSKALDSIPSLENRNAVHIISDVLKECDAGQSPSRHGPSISS